MSHTDPYAEIQRLVATLPESVPAVLARAAEFRRTGEVEFAIELLKRSRERHPVETIRIKLARMLLEIDRPRDAMAELVALLKEDSNHVEALLSLTQALAKIGEPERARKMLERAKELGAPASRTATLEAVLTGRVKDDAIPFQNGAPRKTLLGLPNARDNKQPAPLSKMGTGSFQALADYDSHGDDNELSLLQEVPNLDGDRGFDQVLSNAGVQLPEAHEPVYRAQHDLRTTADLAGPSDETSALILEDRTIDDDATQAVQWSDELAEAMDETGYLPAHEDVEETNFHIKLEDHTEEDIPEAPVFFDEDSFVRDHRSDSVEVDVDEDIKYKNPPAPATAPAKPAQMPQHQAQPVSQTERPSGWSSDQFPAFNPPVSAVPSASDEPSIRLGPVLKIAGLVSVLLLGLVVAMVVSGTMEAKAVEELLNESAPKEESYAYGDLKEARDLLWKATNTSGFFPISLPGSKGPKLRAEAKARFVLTSSLLNYLHADPLPTGFDAAKTSLEASNSKLAASDVYLKLSSGKPFEASELGATHRKTFAGELAIEEADVWARLELEQARSAHRAVASLRAVENLGPRQEGLILAVDAANREENVLPKLKTRLKEDPENTQFALAFAQLAMHDKETRKEAEQVLTKLLESEARGELSQRDIAEISLALAQTLVLANDLDRAEEKFREAQKAVPNQARYAAHLVNFYVSQRRFDEAATLIERHSTPDLLGPELWFAQAHLLLRRGSPEKAAHELQQVVSADPRREWWLGLAYFDLGRYEEAAGSFTKAAASTLAPSDAETMRILANGLAKSEFDATLKGIEDEIEKDKEAALRHWAKGKALLEQAKSGSLESQDKLLKSAAKSFEKAQEIEADERWAFGECEANLIRLDEKPAEKACLAGRKLNPHYVPGMVLTARLKRLQDEIQEARELITKASVERPEDIEAGIEKIRLYMQNRDLEGAQKEIDKWHTREPGNHTIKVLEGRIAYLRAEFQRAAAYLETAYKEEPTDGEAAVFYGSALAKLGLHEQAGENLRDMLSHPEWGPYGWMLLADVRRVQSRWRDVEQNLAAARRDFNKTLGPKLRFSLLYTQYARYYAERHRWDHPAVLRNLEKAKSDGDLDEPEMNLTFAEYYLKRRKPDVEAASQYIESVLRVAPYRCDAIQFALNNRKAFESKRVREIEELRKNHCDG